MPALPKHVQIAAAILDMGDKNKLQPTELWQACTTTMATLLMHMDIKPEMEEKLLRESMAEVARMGAEYKRAAEEG